ncbi:hypothetical protein [Solidesulfovibrio sp. C21]|uniref:hypothetical protein n=1 Tax=Solidesulfovibrio sp. C21 TaxID=3398613 RepID=UPI0039FC79A8
MRMKPKTTKTTNVNNRFKLSPASTSAINKKVIYQVKLRRLHQILEKYGVEALDLKHLTILCDALCQIVDNKIKKGIIKK